MMDTSFYKVYMYDVIGAIHEVHKELGAGLKEVCYQEAFEMELKERDLSYYREMSFHPKYHGITMSTTFRLDFLCKEDIIVECKSVSEIDNLNRAQLFNYMRLLKKPCGILVNFAPSFAIIERYLYDKNNNSILTIDGKVLKTFPK